MKHDNKRNSWTSCSTKDLRNGKCWICRSLPTPGTVAGVCSAPLQLYWILPVQSPHYPCYGTVLFSRGLARFHQCRCRMLLLEPSPTLHLSHSSASTQRQEAALGAPNLHFRPNSVSSSSVCPGQAVLLHVKTTQEGWPSSSRDREPA